MNTWPLWWFCAVECRTESRRPGFSPSNTNQRLKKIVVLQALVSLHINEKTELNQCSFHPLFMFMVIYVLPYVLYYSLNIFEMIYFKRKLIFTFVNGKPASLDKSKNKIIQELHKNISPETHRYNGYVCHSQFTISPFSIQKDPGSTFSTKELCGFILWSTDRMMVDVDLDSQWEK